MDISVLYEDNHLIVLNKKPGDLTQGDKTKDLPLPDKPVTAVIRFFGI